MYSYDLARYLQSPVTAQWQDIGLVQADARTGDMWADEHIEDLLHSLPTLRTLVLHYKQAIDHVDFLSQLPQLTSLGLYCQETPLGPDPLATSLLQCGGLTELSLSSGFTTAQCSALFAKLTIRKLTFRGGNLGTLQCFAAGPITQSLQELTISSAKLPTSELPHLYSLRRLRTLNLDESFTSRLDDAAIGSLSPPSQLLPALTKLSYRKGWSAADYVERQGPSYEWMQARLTQ